MIFEDSLASVDAAKHCDGEEELDDSNGGLENYRADSGQTQDTVRRNEMRVVALVYLDDQEGTEEAQNTE